MKNWCLIAASLSLSSCIRRPLAASGRARHARDALEVAHAAPWRFMCAPPWRHTPFALGRGVEEAQHRIGCIALDQGRASQSVALVGRLFEFRSLGRMQLPGLGSDPSSTMSLVGPLYRGLLGRVCASLPPPLGRVGLRPCVDRCRSPQVFDVERFAGAHLHERAPHCAARGHSASVVRQNLRKARMGAA